MQGYIEICRWNEKENGSYYFGFRVEEYYLEGQRDFVSRLTQGMACVSMWNLSVISIILTKSD